jgi:hypothetical protein
MVAAMLDCFAAAQHLCAQIAHAAAVPFSSGLRGEHARVRAVILPLTWTRIIAKTNYHGDR